MKPTQALHDLGQSVWLDDITRDPLDGGTLSSPRRRSSTAFADHGKLGPSLPDDGRECEEVLIRFARAGVDVEALAARLQDEGAKAFVKSWNELLAGISAKTAQVAKAG